jgi:hypothetical protein
VYLLKISGFIPEKKYREFEQSLAEIREQIKDDCTDFTISRDLKENSLYYVSIYWNNKQSYETFLHSRDYQVLHGSFRVLGSIKKITAGEISDYSKH